MPVFVTLTIADPPAAPPGYTLCAFEVRSYTAGAEGGGTMRPITVFSGTTAGYEDAANVLVKAVAGALRDVGVGFRLAAVAWWIDAPLSKQTDGRERMVSVYDAGKGRWGEWVAEERIGDPGAVPTFSPKLTARQALQINTTRSSGNR